MGLVDISLRLQLLSKYVLAFFDSQFQRAQLKQQIFELTVSTFAIDLTPTIKLFY